MEDLLFNKSNSKNGDNLNSGQPNFGKAILLIILVVLGSLLIQNISNTFSSSIRIILAGTAILFLCILSFSKPFNNVIDSPYFAISGLLSIALGTAFGTFFSQNAPDEVFTQQYGDSGSTILQLLQLDDVFHSWWYVGLFALLAISLCKISLRKKISRENLGFHLAHLGPIIILAGFWGDYFYGSKGIIQLEEGESKNLVRLYDGHSNYISDSTYLDFSIQLDNFEFEKHEPDYRIQIWKRDTSNHSQTAAQGATKMNGKPLTIIASLPLVPMEIRHIYGTDIYFRLKKMYPNFRFEYTYPATVNDIEPVDPGIQLDIKTTYGDGTLQLLANKPNRNKVLDLDMFGGWIEFYWELPEDIIKALQTPIADNNNRIIFAGKKRMVHYLVNGEVISEPLVENVDFPIPNKENTLLHILHIFPDASLLKAIPSSKDDQLINPVAGVEIWHKGKYSQNAYIYPSNGGRIGGAFNIPGSNFLLALESVKSMETKFYKSDISIVNKDKEVLKKQAIKVNKPMLYHGYRFYQTDYNPNNPEYSGIGVTHEPGLYLIYFGFYVLVLGVGLMFYGRIDKLGYTRSF